jgi:predicted alpha-1,2-mannosidase
VLSAFSNTNKVAQAGYYAAQSNQPNTITSQFTATAHSSMARFTYPATTQAGFLIKLRDAQNGEFAPSTATVVSNHEISGSETSGHFCGESTNDGQPQTYTVHFDITFDQPFTASQVITGSSGPSAVYLTFDTTTAQTVQAKLGISYVSDANAALDWQSENPGWDFDTVKAAAQQDWNTLLGRIQVSGSTFAKTQMFYSLLYKDFIQPNISSDVNGQFMGADMAMHTVANGQHDQYGMYSGWEIYHSLSQLQAMLDPAPAGDMVQSQLNYYSEDHLLQQWGYNQDNNYVMVGDPMQSIIADFYAFGAHNFDTATALKDMLAQATTVNDVRPGEALEDKYGYLPEDGSYGCCNPHGYVPTLEEYNTEDLALSFFADALGDHTNAAMLRARANNWENVFNPVNNLLNPRNANGQFVPGITGTTTDRYVEGDAYEYLWNTPNSYAALFSLLGGNSQVAPMLRDYLSQPNGFGMFAQLTNEFDFGEQYMGLYASDPAGTQQAVNNIRNTMYQPGPSLDNNDDLGANSSTFIWEMLGMYPENSGSDNLVFNSPAFPYTQITLPNGKAVTNNGPRRVIHQLLRGQPEAQRQPVPQAVRAVLDAEPGRHARLDAQHDAHDVGHRPGGRPAVLQRRAAPGRGVPREPADDRRAWRQRDRDARRGERDHRRADDAGQPLGAGRGQRDRVESGRRPYAPERPQHDHAHDQAGREHRAELLLGADHAEQRRHITARAHADRAGRPAGQPARGVQQRRGVRRRQRQPGQLRRRRAQLLGRGTRRPGCRAGQHSHRRRHQLRVAPVRPGPAERRHRVGSDRDRQRPDRHAAGRLPRRGHEWTQSGTDDAHLLRRQHVAVLARLVRLDAQCEPVATVVRQRGRDQHAVPQLRRLQRRPGQHGHPHLLGCAAGRSQQDARQRDPAERRHAGAVAHLLDRHGNVSDEWRGRGFPVTGLRECR